MEFSNYCLSFGFLFYFQNISYRVVNKCAAPKRKTGYESIDNQFKKIPTFYHPLKKPNFNKQWICFVNQINWKSTQYSVLSELHFKVNFVTFTKRGNLKWQLNPVLTNN